MYDPAAVAPPETPPRPTVVIVPTTAFGDLLRGCLESLRAQTWQDFDVLVVADGVDGPCPDWVREERPRTDVVHTGRRSGFAAAVNAGLRASRHPLVMLLNDDARPAPDCLFALDEAQRRQPAFAGFACRIAFYYSPSVLESAGDGFSLAGRGFHRAWRADDGPPWDREQEVFGACAAAALYRRQLFDDVGLFDEELFAIHEDVDLCLRARRRGLRFLYVPTARALHRGSVTLGRKSDDAVYLDSRNSELVLLKNIPFAPFLRMLPWYALYSWYNALCALRYGRFGAWARGKAAVLPRAARALRRGRLDELSARVPFDEVSRHFDREWHWAGLRRILADRWSAFLAVGAPLLLAVTLTAAAAWRWTR